APGPARPAAAGAHGRPRRGRPQPAPGAGGAGRRPTRGGWNVSDVFGAVEEARREGRPVVMGTTVRTEGDPPSAPGNRALFAADGALLAGTIGCNGLGRKAGRDGGGALGPWVAAPPPGGGGAPGGGGLGVFLGASAGPPRLVVGGAGPVADAL